VTGAIEAEFFPARSSRRPPMIGSTPSASSRGANCIHFGRQGAPAAQAAGGIKGAAMGAVGPQSPGLRSAGEQAVPSPYGERAGVSINPSPQAVAMQLFVSRRYQACGDWQLAGSARTRVSNHSRKVSGDRPVCGSSDAFRLKARNNPNIGTDIHQR